MRHFILGILVLCLTLAAGVAQAQRVVGTEIFIDWENVTEEQKQQFFDQHGITLEELQRQIDNGTARVVSSTFSGIELGKEELRHLEEQQRRQGEMLLQVYAEIGVTEEEMVSFSEAITGGIIEEYGKIAEEISDSFDFNVGELTRDDVTDICKTVADIYVDKLIQPMFNAIRTESANFFDEEQYTLLATRFYQIAELGKGGFGMFSGEDDCLDKELFKLFLLPSVVDLTEEQLDGLAQIQKEFFTEFFELQYMLEEEQELINTQLLESEEEQAVINERMEKMNKELVNRMEDESRQLFPKMKTKLDTLLTAEQKAKLSKIKADIPDYMRSALAGMKPDGINDNAEEASGPWRPGANSWVPGMGVPKDLQNDPREAPRIREPRDGRRFPE